MEVVKSFLIFRLSCCFLAGLNVEIIEVDNRYWDICLKYVNYLLLSVIIYYVCLKSYFLDANSIVTGHSFLVSMGCVTGRLLFFLCVTGHIFHFRWSD